MREESWFSYKDSNQKCLYNKCINKLATKDLCGLSPGVFQWRVHYRETVILWRNYKIVTLKEEMSMGISLQGHSTWTVMTLTRLFLSFFYLKELSRVTGEGNGNPLQYSCLENPMDGGALRATVHGVTKSRTRLSDFTFTLYFHHWRRKWQPTPVFLPGESQGRRSLLGCHLWGRTESDTTEAT